MFSCIFTAYFQNTFLLEHPWKAASEITKFFEPNLRVVLYKICSEIFVKFTGKHLCQSIIFRKLQTLRMQLYGKRDLATRLSVLWNFKRILLYNICEWLPLRPYNLGAHYMEYFRPGLKFQSGEALKFCSDYMNIFSLDREVLELFCFDFI